MMAHPNIMKHVISDTGSKSLKAKSDEILREKKKKNKTKKLPFSMKSFCLSIICPPDTQCLSLMCHYRGTTQSPSQHCHFWHFAATCFPCCNLTCNNTGDLCHETLDGSDWNTVCLVLDATDNVFNLNR